MASIPPGRCTACLYGWHQWAPPTGEDLEAYDRAVQLVRWRCLCSDQLPGCRCELITVRTDTRTAAALADMTMPLPRLEPRMEPPSPRDFTESGLPPGLALMQRVLEGLRKL